jgi:integrase
MGDRQEGVRKKLTKRLVEALEPGSILWDSEVKGFGARCQRRDPVYIVKANIKGRTRWFSIGTHGAPWTVEKARSRALVMLGDIADGKDLAAVREAERRQPTMKQLAQWFLDEHSAQHKKPLSYESDRRNVCNHVEPLLGELKAADVTRADIDRFKRDVSAGKTARVEVLGKRAKSIVRGGPGAANRCLALLSKMFNWAEQRGYRLDGSNPCRHVEKYRERRHERFLSNVELATLAGVMVDCETTWSETEKLRERIAAASAKDAKPLKLELRAAEKRAESPFVLAAIRLLVFTGARLNEILALRWEDVDIQRALMDLPDSKTGRKTIYLNAPALAVLASLPRLQGNPHVICGERDGAGMVNLQKPWRRLRQRAELEDVRLHDLRHSFASVAAAGGLSLPMIGKLLGHRSTLTTQRYAHLADDPARAANEAVAARLSAAMAPKSVQAEVTPIGKADRARRQHPR